MGLAQHKNLGKGESSCSFDSNEMSQKNPDSQFNQTRRNK